MRRTSLLLAAFAFLPARALHAQARATGVEHIPAATLAALTDSLVARHAPSRVLGDRGSYTYVIVQRDTTGEPEVHERWTDLLVVRSGSGTMVHGGRVSGGRAIGDGETRGGEIVGGTRQRLAPGDVLIIPAGIPHQAVIAPGERLTYLAIKIAAK